MFELERGSSARGNSVCAVAADAHRRWHQNLARLSRRLEVSNSRSGAPRQSPRANSAWARKVPARQARTLGESGSGGSAPRCRDRHGPHGRQRVGDHPRGVRAPDANNLAHRFAHTAPHGWGRGWVRWRFGATLTVDPDLLVPDAWVEQRIKREGRTAGHPRSPQQLATLPR